MLKCSCKVLKYSVLVADSTYFISGDQHIHVKPGVLARAWELNFSYSN